MGSWINIVARDLETYLVGAQVTALREAALADGQTDPFPEVMQDRCNYLRSRIAGVCVLDDTPYSVPPEFKTDAIALIIESMMIRLQMELSKDQVRMIDRAYDDLKLAVVGDLLISSPAVTTQPQSQRPSFGDRTLQSTRAQQDGA